MGIRCPILGRRLPNASATVAQGLDNGCEYLGNDGQQLLTHWENFVHALGKRCGSPPNVRPRNVLRRLALRIPALAAVAGADRAVAAAAAAAGRAVAAAAAAAGRAVAAAAAGAAIATAAAAF